MISIICSYTNKELMDNMLIHSLSNQTYTDYELVLLDSKKLGFKSAAQALNYGAEQAKGDILVFAHQDIEFLDNNCLELINKFSEEIDYDIAGVAGVETGGKVVYSSVTMGDKHIQAGQKIVEPMKLDSLDECLLIIKKDKFIKFDDYHSWHFYAVEYSLRCSNVYAIPIYIYHLSVGWSLDKSYWKTLKLVAKHFKDRKIIPTALGQYNNGPFLPIEIMLRRIKISINKIFFKKI